MDAKKYLSVLISAQFHMKYVPQTGYEAEV